MNKTLHSLLLWILALVVTLGSAVFQRMTGPSYPISGKTELAGSPVVYELPRTHGGVGGEFIQIIVPDTNIIGKLVYRRYPTNDEWTAVRLTRYGDTLQGIIPHQPPAGKVEYHIELKKADAEITLPFSENAVIRFRGRVPAWALLPHILAMFVFMLLSTRTGLQALRKQAPLKGYLWTTFSLLIVGGFIFGPIVQHFAFGDWWAGFPLGYDLTDNKTLIALLGWIAAIFAFQRSKHYKVYIWIAALITLVIFLIPHSMQGSELNYSAQEQIEDMQ
ncbi:MAG: hypothetical protein U5R06_07565 [candidate division KSB1 bacterium]|nr:hypothetical protein [candidate division KSB1 bacterium]